MKIEEKSCDVAVAVIIPCYNMANYLAESIESVLAQTHKNLEIIVVDDGSTDNTPEIAHRCISAFPDVRYFRINHGGVSRAMNFGVRLSHSEYFLCLGADDKLAPTYIERCLKEMLKDDKNGFVWTATQEFGYSKRVRYPNMLHFAWSGLNGFGGQLGAALIRREAFDQVGGYDESLSGFEDWDLCMRLNFKGWHGVALRDVLHFSYVHKPYSLRHKRFRQPLWRKYPVMYVYVPFMRVILKAVKLFRHPIYAFMRVKNYNKQLSPDEAEYDRIDERLSFGLDIGAGANKILGLGCDIRKVSDVQCDMRFLPFKDKAFVISTLRHSLEHIKDWALALEEAKRVAKNVYVFLPKKEVWYVDPSHVEPFSLGKPIREFELGECYEINCEISSAA